MQWFNHCDNKTIRRYNLIWRSMTYYFHINRIFEFWNTSPRFHSSRLKIQIRKKYQLLIWSSPKFIKSPDREREREKIIIQSRKIIIIRADKYTRQTVKLHSTRGLLKSLLTIYMQIKDKCPHGIIEIIALLIYKKISGIIIDSRRQE